MTCVWHYRTHQNIGSHFLFLKPIELMKPSLSAMRGNNNSCIPDLVLCLGIFTSRIYLLQELHYEVSHVLNVNSINDDTFDWSGTVFVLETFDGEQYDILCSKKCRCVHVLYIVYVFVFLFYIVT